LKTDFYLGDWIVRPQRDCIECDGKVVHLAPKAMAVLQCLARASGEVVSRQDLFDTIWPGGEVTDDALTQRVVELRKAFGDSAHHARYIETIPKIGFRLIPSVMPLTDELGRDLKAKSDADPLKSIIRTSLFVTSTILAVLALFWYLASHRNIQETTTVEKIPSIAVLPFVNMSDDASNEYFSDGISEELLSLLAKIPELRVISRSSAFSFKGKDLDTPTIAQHLNVDHILEGSVRKVGNQVRITAQLIEARSDTHLWAATYDRTLNDIFAIQNEIAAAVVDALKLTLLGDALMADQIDPEAFALYLRAMYLGNRGEAEAYEQAIALLKNVLAISPNYARAWRGLAANYINQVGSGLRTVDEGYALAREATNHALSLDPNNALAQGSLGWIAMTYDGDLQTAARQLEYALSLEPTNPVNLLASGELMLKLGRLDEAISLWEHVSNRDPVNPTSHSNLCTAYLWAGRFDEAIASMRTALTLSPGRFRAHYRIGEALLHKGQPEAALEEIMKEPMKGFRLIGQAMAYHTLGRAAKAEAALTELIDKYEQAAAYNIAYVFAFRGEADRAFAWLNKAFQYKDPGLLNIVVNNLFANLYDDPRWLPFLESIGMSSAQLDAIEFEVRLPE
jgi:TolB-like protein/DNA-binding winged helix-turn-helix (wHTH) protein/Flp pilus assembly protein TadD